MSFGFESQDAVIDAALRKAEDHDVLLLAAASNVGRDMVGARSWPAATMTMLCASTRQRVKDFPTPRIRHGARTLTGLLRLG